MREYPTRLLQRKEWFALEKGPCDAPNHRFPFPTDTISVSIHESQRHPGMDWGKIQSFKQLYKDGWIESLIWKRRLRIKGKKEKEKDKKAKTLTAEKSIL